MRTILYFIIAAVCLYWPLKSIIIRKTRKSVPGRSLMWIALACMGVSFALMGCFSIDALKGNVWIEMAYSTVVPLIGVFYFLFIRKLTAEEGVRVKDLIILVPVLLLIASGYAFDALTTRAQWTQYVTTLFNGEESDSAIVDSAFTYRYWGGYWLQRIALLVELLAVIFYGNRQIKIYNHELENYYSELKGLSDSVNIYTTAFAWAAAVVVVTFTLSDNVFSGRLSPLTIIACLIAVVAVLAMGAYTSSLEQNAADVARMAEEDMKKEAEKQASAPQYTSSETPMERYAKALKEAVAQQVFLEPGLELTDLADRIGTNRTYLSNIIHDEYGQNFSEFINSRRIAYAIKMMQEADESYPVRYVAMKCGYNSLQSFYNNFAKYTGGKTPASYLKK